MSEHFPIPEKYRVSADINDTQAYELLLKADAAQKELSEKVSSPFAMVSPLTRERGKAMAAIRSLLSVPVLEDSQKEQLADAYALTGRYDLAAETSVANKAEYEDTWNAVFKPDGSWCAHPVRSAYVKKRIFSLKHGKEKSLMACNACGFMNVMSTPQEIRTAYSTHNRHVGQTKGMTIEQAISYHRQHLT